MAYSCLFNLFEKQTADPSLVTPALSEFCSCFLPEGTLELVAKAEQQRAEIKGLREAYAKRLNDLAQSLRNKSIRLYNVTETPNEDITLVIYDIFRHKMNIEIELSDIESCHRIFGIAKRPRPVIVRFFSSRIMTEVLSRKKYLKGTNIGVCEDLCPDRVYLLKKATNIFGKHNVWIERGAIKAVLPNKKQLKFHSSTELDDYLKSRESDHKISSNRHQ